MEDGIRASLQQALAEERSRSPYMGTFTPAPSQAIPEPEARHIIDGSEALIVLEYPGQLRIEEVVAIRTELQRQGIKNPLILFGGIHLEAVDEDTMRRLGWVRAPREELMGR